MSPDILHDILEECINARGCYPAANHINQDFLLWMLQHKRSELIPFALEFKKHCEDFYNGC